MGPSLHRLCLLFTFACVLSFAKVTAAERVVFSTLGTDGKPDEARINALGKLFRRK